MKTLLLTFAAIFTLCIFAIAPAANAARPFKGMLSSEADGPFKEIRLTAVRHLLNFRKETPLTDEQKSQVKEIFRTHRSEIKTQFEKSREARQLMQKTVKEKGADDVATKAAAQAIGDAARERALLAAKISSEIRPLLTAAQQERLEAARAEIDPLLGRLFEEAAE